jgi:hypothetical protein
MATRRAASRAPALVLRRRPAAQSRDLKPPLTIEAFEAKEQTARLTTMNNRAAVEALEKAGVQFIPENWGGVGMRMRERQS